MSLSKKSHFPIAKRSTARQKTNFLTVRSIAAGKTMWSPLLVGDGQVAPKILLARRKLKQFSRPISVSVSLLLSSCFHSLNFCFSLFHLKSHFFLFLPFFVARALSICYTTSCLCLCRLGLGPMWGGPAAAPLPVYPGRYGGVWEVTCGGHYAGIP